MVYGRTSRSYIVLFVILLSLLSVSLVPDVLMGNLMMINKTLYEQMDSDALQTGKTNQNSG